MAVTASTTSRNLAPHPKDFESFEDAFAFPVSAVRRFEVQLQSTLVETRSRLRSLVGDSYRELLGNADMIVDMHHESQRLDAAMDLVTHQCSARLVENSIASYKSYAHSTRRDTLATQRLAADLALSQSSLAASRRAQSSHQPLLAAKLLILARLFLQSASSSSKSLSSTSQPRYPSEILDVLWRKHRRRTKTLLAAFDDNIKNVTNLDNGKLLLAALVAYALVTTSSTADALRHFLHVRRNALSESLAQSSATSNEPDNTSSILSSIKTLFRTLNQSLHLFPKRVADPLARHRDSALLKDPDLRFAIASDLQIYETLISPEITAYTPWIRIETLDTQQVLEHASTWANDAASLLFLGLESHLSRTSDPKTIVRIRKDVISEWLLLQPPQAISGVIDLSESVDRVRELCAKRFNHVIRTKSTAAEQALNKHLDSPGSSSSSPVAQSLWERDLQGMSIEKGATSFRRQLQVRLRGKDQVVQDLQQNLDMWQADISELSTTIRSLKDIRWNDILDLENVTDSEKVAAIVARLSRDDPRNLTKTLTQEHHSAVSRCTSLLKDAITSLSTSKDPTRKARAIQLLRIVREFMQHSTPIATGEADPSTSLAQGMQTLSAIIAEGMAADATTYLNTRQDNNIFSCTPTYLLWGGEPPLPQQPSTACNRFAYNIQKAMQVHGTDIWTCQVVDAVKSVLSSRARKDAWELLLETQKHEPRLDGKAKITSQHADVEGEITVDESAMETTEDKTAPDGDQNSMSEKASVEAQQRAIQLAYDVLYLCTLSKPSRPSSSSSSLASDQVSSDAPKAGSEDVRDPSNGEEVKTWEEIVHQALETSGLLVGGRDEQGNAALEPSAAGAGAGAVEIRSRLEKSANEYHHRTWLLFGLLSPPR